VLSGLSIKIIKLELSVTGNSSSVERIPSGTKAASK
jgi:hypothetical protein